MTVHDRIKQSEQDHLAHMTRRRKAAFKRGTGVYHIKSCPDPEGVVWLYRLRAMPTHSSETLSGGGFVVGGVGTDGRMYSREVYYSDCFGSNPGPVDYNSLPWLWLSE